MVLFRYNLRHFDLLSLVVTSFGLVTIQKRGHDLRYYLVSYEYNLMTFYSLFLLLLGFRISISPVETSCVRTKRVFWPSAR